MSTTFLLLALAGPAQAEDLKVTGQVEVSTETSAEEKLDFVADALNEMEAAQKAVTKLLEQVEKEGVQSRIDCVRNKLASIRTLKKVSENADISMQDALARNQEKIAEFEFRKVAVAIGKVRQFLAEAEACTNDGQSAAGTSDITIEGDLTSGEIGSTVPELVVDVPSPPDSPFQ